MRNPSTRDLHRFVQAAPLIQVSAIKIIDVRGTGYLQIE